MCLAEVTIAVNNSLRVLVFVLHIFPLQFFRHIIVFSLTDLIQITALYRCSVGVLLHLRSSCDYAHKRSSRVLMRPVVAEFLFGSFHIYFIAFTRFWKLNFAQIHFILHKMRCLMKRSAYPGTIGFGCFVGIIFRSFFCIRL